MRIYKFLFIFLLLFTTLLSGHAQKKFDVSGHLETLEMAWVQGKVDSAWQTMSTIYNRLDFRWYPTRSLTFHLGARNLLDYGQIVTTVNNWAKVIPGQEDYSKFVSKDEGYFDLTEAWSSGNSYTLYSNIDRLYGRWTTGNFEATVGRQRINWGINLVWNPNDIFNTFNYFNFDYVERPGCDAVHLQYYTGMTSSLQTAFKIDHNENITAAAMYKFNKWNYDFQFLGGKMTDDYVLGLGWSGQIEKAGFNGEATYFHDADNYSDTTGQLVASIGANYTFRSGLYFQLSGLYNSEGTTGKAGRGNMFAMNLDISPKTLTLARYSLFAQVAYPITPLINADVSGIYNPNDRSGFIGPSVDISLKPNLSFLLTAQVFTGDKGSEFGDYGTLAYMRLKWSF
ncbi:MAG: hypothetical protein K9G58_02135 [Bacteroidales bacterium]|nr:hypothetical protein [Bacteroidales bacterium]MCF8388904.1 hypothetical protein [Bacteroidales bacterium]MCF8396935.1 hypothetical protein [Bacteroidales bacterium]